MTKTLKQVLEENEKEFEEQLVPLKPGFSFCKDWTKNLEGTTANYMTLKQFLKDSSLRLIQAFEEMVERRICQECQCEKPYPEMNRCLNCRKVIENKITSNQTLQDILEELKELK